MRRLRSLFESFWSQELDRLVVDANDYPLPQGEFAMRYESRCHTKRYSCRWIPTRPSR
ncbi:putative TRANSCRIPTIONAL REGULATORY PROTEIN domain protein [Mycobacterium kansasii 732]|nr:putative TRANSCRIPTIONAL REGULATORY PROTEIN domain protein [Mycobacterium kansasii 732]